MLVDMPDAVHTIYDLIVAVANRNGDKWKGNILEAICVEVFILQLLRCVDKIHPLTSYFSLVNFSVIELF